MHNSDDILLDALQAGARGFLLKSDADDYLDGCGARAVAAQAVLYRQGVGEADRIASSTSSAGSAPDLTLREKSVVQLIAEGRTHQEMADLLGVSSKTVEAHRAAALRKLNLKTTADSDPLCGPQQARRGLIAKTCAVQGGRDAIV